MLLLQPRGALQDGLSVVLGGIQEALETPSAELPTKTVKTVSQVNSSIEATARNALRDKL